MPLEVAMEKLRRDDLPLGGFAGLKEHQLVMNPQLFGPGNRMAWAGLGRFVYLADATFMPKGETGLHPHREIDVISVMVKGRIAHEGSLKEGQELRELDVQVQRAGGEGFQHNEVNPDDQWNRMLQLWFVPEKSGEAAGYQLHQPTWGKTTRVYGGGDGGKTYASKTTMDIALLKKDDRSRAAGDVLVYIAKGAGTVGGEDVQEGDLLRGRDLELTSASELQAVIIGQLQN
jgi:redox-sensitive bicupin YhaK (pirin superfamily)